MTRATGLILATLFLASLTACASEPTNEPAPVVEPTHTVEPTPTPETEPAPVVIPECQQLVTNEQITAIYDEYWQYFDDENSSKIQGFHIQELGPVAQDSLAQAAQQTQCSWGVPYSDGVVSVLATELPEDVSDHFVNELRASVYTESTSGDIVTFEYSEEMTHIWYGFRDTFWVSTLGEGGIGDVGVQALENLRQVNPSTSG